LIGLFNYVNSQIPTRFVSPDEISSRESFQFSSKSTVIDVLNPEIRELISKDSIKTEGANLFTFGYAIETNIGLNNSGDFFNLSDGYILWSLRIISPNAYSINLVFDELNIVEGAELFIYNSDKTMIHGPYTSSYNSKAGNITTDLLEGDQIILEFIQPSWSINQSKIHIKSVVCSWISRYV
jgi:lysyl endopeptidase